MSWWWRQLVQIVMMTVFWVQESEGLRQVLWVGADMQALCSIRRAREAHVLAV